MKPLLKKTLYSVWFLLMVTLPSLAFALEQPPNPTFPGAPLNPFVNASTHDLSIGFLSQLFGRVSVILSGQSESILSRLFLEYSWGIILIGGFLLSYFAVRGILDTAHDGTALGRKLSHWTLIRTVLGVGIIVPKFGGYGLLQLWVMWIVIQGVNLADTTWNQGLEYLKMGGQLYSQNAIPKKGEGEQKIELGFIAPPIYKHQSMDHGGSYATALDVLRSTICLEALNKYGRDYAKTKTADMQAHPQNYTALQKQNSIVPLYTNQPYKIDWNTTNKTLTIPKGSSTEVARFPTIPDGACGVYTWQVSQKLQAKANIQKAMGGNIFPTSNPADLLEKYEADKLKGLEQMYATLDATAIKLVQNVTNELTQKPKDPDEEALNSSDLASSLLTAALEYQIDVYLDRIYANRTNSQDATAKSAFIKDAEREGWAMAGSFYMDMILLQNINNQTLDTNADNYQIKIVGNYPPAYAAYSKTGKRHQAYNALAKKGGIIDSKFGTVTTKYDKIEILQEMLQSAVNASAKAQENATKLNNQNAGADGQSTEVRPSSFRLGSVGHSLGQELADAFGIAPLKPLLEAIGDGIGSICQDIIGTIANPINSNPILYLHNLGMTLIEKVGASWVAIGGFFAGVLALNTTAETALSAIAVGTSWNFFSAASAVNVSNTINTMHNLAAVPLTWVMLLSALILPLFMAISGLLFTVGATLAFYLPLVPLLIFIFGVISWLIFVIEAMAAAPLVGLGLSHPEGHDLLGKSEQALMLLFSVFVRPVLMVIGLIAAIIISKIAFTLILMAFKFFVDSNVVISSASGLMMIPIIFMMTFAVVAAQNQIFQLIVKLPETACRWIGISASNESGQVMQLVGNVKEGMGQLSGAAQKGADSSISNNAGRTEKIKPDKKMEKKKSGAPSITGRNLPGGGGGGGGGGAAP